MYLEYYGLLKEPFHITPDPEFLYLSPSHKEALGVILFGVENRAGFMMITGGVGLGKTTILRSAMQHFDRERVKTILVFNPCLSYRDLVRLIYEELGLEVPEGEDQFQLIQRLHLALIEEYKQGNNVVLVIDEAQNMPVETLENLRMLSNLETSKDKLLQIILVGQQPELENLLSSEELRQLKQRIAHRATLVKLTPKESADYIQHRLDIALGIKNGPFTKSAVNRIVKHCDGVPRCINVICGNALVSGYGAEQNPIGPKLVQEVIGDIEGRVRTGWQRWMAAPAVALVVLAVLLYLFVSGSIFHRQESTAPKADAPKSMAAPSPGAPSSNGEKKRPEIKAAEGTPAKGPLERAETPTGSFKPSTGPSAAAPAAIPASPPASTSASGPATTTGGVLPPPVTGSPPAPASSAAPSTAAVTGGPGRATKPDSPQPQPEAAQTVEAPRPPEKPPLVKEPSAPGADVTPAGPAQGSGARPPVASRPESPTLAPTPSPAPSTATAREVSPSVKTEAGIAEKTAAPPAVKAGAPGKKEAPDPADIVDWLIDKRSRKKGSGTN
ncbi:MAG: AAA family ATPase [Syntrophobacteraceae bacterium]|jgi:general secretion pathway protein A|nr:AAA family ATPase [Syntrophobacteraceae bacterium]